MSYRDLLLAIFLASLFLIEMAVITMASAQEHKNHPLRGPHPNLSIGEPDPYARATSQTGFPCCHGVDCSEFFGSPVRGVKDGYDGYWFDKWFVRDDQLIKPMTLAPGARMQHHLCLSSYSGQVYCGYVAGGV